MQRENKQSEYFLSSPKNLTPPLVCLVARVCPTLNFVLLTGVDFLQIRLHENDERRTRLTT